jgi:hypothetical protein
LAAVANLAVGGMMMAAAIIRRVSAVFVTHRMLLGVYFGTLWAGGDVLVVMLTNLQGLVLADGLL